MVARNKKRKYFLFSNQGRKMETSYGKEYVEWYYCSYRCRRRRRCCCCCYCCCVFFFFFSVLYFPAVLIFCGRKCNEIRPVDHAGVRQIFSWNTARLYRYQLKCCFLLVSDAPLPINKLRADGWRKQETKKRRTRRRKTFYLFIYFSPLSLSFSLSFFFLSEFSVLLLFAFFRNFFFFLFSLSVSLSLSLSLSFFFPFQISGFFSHWLSWSRRNWNNGSMSPTDDATPLSHSKTHSTNSPINTT